MAQGNRRDQLIAYIEGNQQAFYRLAYSYVRNSDQALDVVQEAIVKALTKVHLLRNPEYMRTWFYRILVNESLMVLRRAKRHPVEDIPLDVLSSEDRDVSRSLDLYKAVSTLEPKYRTVITLRYFEDMKLEEIARITGANLNTVKSRLYRALEILKGTLKEA